MLAKQRIRRRLYEKAGKEKEIEKLEEKVEKLKEPPKKGPLEIVNIRCWPSRDMPGAASLMFVPGKNNRFRSAAVLYRSSPRRKRVLAAVSMQATSNPKPTRFRK